MPSKSTKSASKAVPKPKAKKLKFHARPVVEITATFKDTVGLTAKVAKAIASENVNILAGTGYSASAIYRKATFSLIVDDFAKAEKALDKIGAADVEELSVVLVEMDNQVGALEKVCKGVAGAGINIFYFYATTSSGDTATVVLKTADDKKAIKIINAL